MPDDPFASHQRGLNSPAENWFAITPDDSNDIDPKPRALWLGSSGTLTVQGKDGNSLSFTIPGAGVYPFSAARVLTTTTITEIFGLL